MNDSLLWIGGPEPPDVVTRLAEWRGWTIRTADSGDGADAVDRHRPEAIVVGVVDADVARLRTAVPAALIAYCPPSTTADGVSDAVAAGVDVVLPQDADAWGNDALGQRLTDARPTEAKRPGSSVSDGAGSVGASPRADEAALELDEADLLDCLREVTSRLSAAETPEAMADIACETTHDVLGLDVAAIRLYDPTEEVLRLAAATDAVDELLPDRPTSAVGEGMAGAAFATGEPQIRPDLDGEQFDETRLAICLPLGAHGTISVGSTAPESFGEADISLARLLSTTVTAALDRADRETRLRRRESVLESIQGMVFTIDEVGVIDYVSGPLADRLGESRDEIVGEHVVEFVDVTEFSRAESLIEDGDDEVSVDVRIHPTEGDPFPAHVDLSMLEQGTDGASLVGVVEDRSTLATTREDLRRDHERLWTLFENLPDPVVDAEHVDDGPMIREANDAFAEVFDCDREEIAGQPIDKVLASPGAEPAGSMPPEAINEQVREGEVTGAKVRRETAHGARTFLFRGIPYAENGAVRAFGIYTDVTEIERRERHVKVLDRLLRHNLRNDLGVVIGRAENVLERSDDSAVRTEATDLVEAARELIDLSDTAKRIRRIIEDPVAERSTLSVPELFETVVTDARDRFPGATSGPRQPPTTSRCSPRRTFGSR